MISYYKYFLEIKFRFLLLGINWGFTSLICYIYKETILFILVNSNNYLQENYKKTYFIFTDISEIFYVHLQLIFFISNQITALMLIYHVILFLSSGLYKFEYKNLQFVIKATIFTWFSSLILLNNYIIPTSWNFFLSFQKTNNVFFVFEARILEYLNYFTYLYYICFVNCQLLALMAISINCFGTDLKKTRKFRKLFYLILTIISTLTTPPDIFSQIVMSISLITFFELLIFFKYFKISKVTN